jgi:hypothetical protein
LYSSPARILYPHFYCANWHRTGVKIRRPSKFRRSAAFRAGPICAGIKKTSSAKNFQTNFFGKKLPNKILKVHVKKIAKTKGQLNPQNS